MRAVVIHAARDLRVEERETEPLRQGQALIAVGAGGICGSDLHYFNHGGFGAVRLREPMILGHEVAGTVLQVAPDVSGLLPGDRVAVNPSRPCRVCRFCLEGLPNHCLNMRFYGSAMPMPHIQGAFRERLVCDAGQCVVAPDVPLTELALAEPFAVTLHAVGRAGSLLGARVLVTGCGPIGLLAVAAARLHGAAEIVATDVLAEPLALARALGATAALDTAADPAALQPYTAGKGSVDVMIECSGNERALRGGLDTVRPRGTIVQLGLGGDIQFPQNLLVQKEIAFLGSFRFHAEFALAVRLIAERRVDLTPMLTGTFPIEEARTAFETAGDRRKASKVQLLFA